MVKLTILAQLSQKENWGAKISQNLMAENKGFLASGLLTSALQICYYINTASKTSSLGYRKASHKGDGALHLFKGIKALLQQFWP